MGSCQNEEVKFLALNKFHQKSVGVIQLSFGSEIFGNKKTAASLHLGNYVLLMF